jgi:hypothetical protein
MGEPIWPWPCSFIHTTIVLLGRLGYQLSSHVETEEPKISQSRLATHTWNMVLSTAVRDVILGLGLLIKGNSNALVLPNGRNVPSSKILRHDNLS